VVDWHFARHHRNSNFNKVKMVLNFHLLNLALMAICILQVAYLI
jgi:hypothetical protein